MQELRLVLIIVGLLAIGALLFHGLWTSKKEGKRKFGNKPLGKLSETDEEPDYSAQRAFAPEDDFEIIKKERKEPEFGSNQQTEPVDFDPLISQEPQEDELPSFTVSEEPQDVSATSLAAESDDEQLEQTEEVQEEEPISEPEPTPEPEMEVIVLNVHCAGDAPFVGSTLFDSMQQNGLLYGEMDIYHRHADLSGTGKVLFSVANMMQPGTLAHDDPETFTTKGISFFMTLPCYGEADQNFKLMLKTAQQIADDLGGNVLDEKRNLMTPNRIAAYRQQVRDFTAKLNQADH